MVISYPEGSVKAAHIAIQSAGQMRKKDIDQGFSWQCVMRETKGRK